MTNLIMIAEVFSLCISFVLYIRVQERGGDEC